MPLFTCPIGLLLKSPATGQKKQTVGRVTSNWAKSCSSSFFFQFASFMLIQRVFEPFQCPRTFFSSISGVKTSWRKIDINYPVYTGVNNQIVLPPNCVILFISWLKCTRIGGIITWWILWSHLLQAKIPIWCGFGTLKFWQHWALCTQKIDSTVTVLALDASHLIFYYF